VAHFDNGDTPINYVAFGDSITVGSKARTPENRWLNVFASQVCAFTGRAVNTTNAGLGDNTISPRTTNYALASKPSALERVQADVIDRKPDLVTVAFGLNDMRFGTPAQVFSEDLGRVLDAVRAGLPDAFVVCLNVFHMSKFDSFAPRNRGSVALTLAYNRAIAEHAARLSLPLADVSAAMAFQDSLIHDDGVHAEDLGHRLIGNRVFETFAISALC